MIRYLPSTLLSFFLLATANAATIDDVRQRGVLNCGVNTGLPGFAEKDKDAKWRGFDVDMCRAVAAAVLGDSEKVNYVPLTTPERLQAVADGKVDLLARNTTWTLSRDADMGISFAGINYFDGQGFLVRRKDNLVSALQLENSKVCVQKDSTSEVNARAYFTLNQIKTTFVITSTPGENLEKLIKGHCDVLTSDHSQLYAVRTQTDDPKNYKVLPEVISKEPLSLVVREGDDRWRKVVQWTLFTLINGEALEIYQNNIDRIKAQASKDKLRRLLGLQDKVGAGLGLSSEWAYRIIKQVGNYSEIFDRNIGEDSPLRISRGLNAQWTNGGLLYAPPIR